ncbi:TPA: hypothetical protein EYO12_03410 [Candidatus Saccharibacteria bacterium]|nr:hypothetical protein [Candidatus Saccharibacteria bacterium]HIO87919.1 hypothetical protein [Candidatus Saccharibacteria bacterium]
MSDIARAQSVATNAQNKIAQLDREINTLTKQVQDHKNNYKELKRQAVKEAVDQDGQLVDAAQVRMKAEKEKMNSYDKKAELKQLKRDKSELESDLKVLNKYLQRATSINASVQSAANTVQGKL